MFFTTIIINIVLNIFMQLNQRKNIKIENKEFMSSLNLDYIIIFWRKRIKELAEENYNQ